VVNLPESRSEKTLVVIATLSVAACSVGVWFNPAEFARSWLIAFLFWLGISLGSLAILMVWYLSGGTWIAALRRGFSAASAPLPLLAIAFIPVAFGWHLLHPWATELTAELEHLRVWVSTPFVVLRGVVYFAAWLLLAHVIGKRARASGRAGVIELSAAGVLIYVVTMTFAAWDWSMALGEHRWSMMFGIGTIAGQIISALSFAVLVTTLTGLLLRPIPEQKLIDTGNLMLGALFLLVYAYYSEFLIVWMGNLPGEIRWYRPRIQGEWQPLTVVLLVFWLLVPFVLLLFRRVKRQAMMLAVIAAVVLVMRYFDVLWIVRPSFSPDAFALHWLDPVSLIAIGALWLLAFVPAWREWEVHSS
jgi:hypothetical protein